MIFPNYARTRSQDLPKTYHDAGQWYWLKPEALGKPLFQNARMVELSESDAQDIDTLSDWRMAELKYKIRQGEKI